MSALKQLVHQLSKLPGIGEKTAMRLALFIVRQPSTYAQSMAKALLGVSESFGFCHDCFHLTDQNPCSICQNENRTAKIICVVEDSSDLIALEKSRGFKGRYHVLQGALSPIDGIGPEQLRVQELLGRVHRDSVEEIILATNPTVTGDATALYISKLIHPLRVKVTRLASGLPVGSDIEYMDALTLAKALELRVEY
ncbi:MAG: Recombination protein RecR [uncultured bacterium]|nr:MAG: Recombination protein RecR [uncultured bacterium]